MPGTTEELVALVAQPGPAAGHRWADGTTISPGELLDLAALRAYALVLRRRRRWGGAQVRARRLLRSLLSAGQRDQLARLGYFYVAAASGAVYRLDPRHGHAERVERHGRRWFAKVAYCLHDEPDAGQMPPADRTVAHLLLLSADEPAFLEAANASRRDDQLWNGDYLRRVRAGRGLSGVQTPR